MSTGDSEGPAWQKFWMSVDHETESAVSGDGGSSHMPPTPDTRSNMMSPEAMQRPGVDRLDSLLPGDSASHTGGADSPEASAFAGAGPSNTNLEGLPFTFKFKAPNGRVHRLQIVASAGLAELILVVAEKLGSETEALGGVPTFENDKLSPGGFALSYLDNEGDTVSLTTDRDLIEAISLARQGQKDKVDLFVHDPEKPAMAVTVEPQPSLAKPPTPPESMMRQRKNKYQEENEEEDEVAISAKGRRAISRSEGKSQEQVVPGVPNELLLPGAIGVLAAVVVVTFAIGRASSK